VIKQINIKMLTDKESEKAAQEAKIMEYLKHPNVIRFRETYKTK